MEVGMQKTGWLIAVLLAFCAATWGQNSADPWLMEQINKIPALDNHTHVPKVVGPLEKDDDYDALPCDTLEPTADPATIRHDNPLFLKAWKALYGYKYEDTQPKHVQEAVAKAQSIRHQQGDNFPTWVLDKLNTKYMFANRVAMGPGLKAPRFLWVPFDDALMVPLNNQALADENSDRKFFYGREAGLLKHYMEESGVTALPASLDDYVSKIVVPTLERQKKAGAVAIKFEAAYLRPLNFGEPQAEQAAAIYAKYAAGGTPTKTEDLVVQNELFRKIAQEAGQLRLAIHIHTGAGCGGYFDIAGSNPSLLDSVLNDPELRKTNFVLIHGGSGPYSKVTAFLLGKPNVYTDISEQVWMLSTRAVSQVLRDWLEWYPEKIFFGTDLFPGNSPAYDWDAIGYVATTSGRTALGLALTGMMQDGEITRDRAVQLARMVLIGNAAKLYGLPQ
jgi:predicted TIM-barrel fold metal-dependent hydrolase